MKRWWIFARAALCYGLVLCFLWVILPVSADSEIYSRVIRLHVLADSDKEEAQEVKLAVRDALLSYGEELFSDCQSREEAVALLGRERKAMESYVNQLLEQWGLSYRAQVSLSEEHYGTREYGGFRLPAGEYLSLRVILGRGEGKNWWCVMFPPVCLSCARPEDELLAGGVGEDSAKVFTVDAGRYRFRFRILEFFGSLFG